MNKFPFSMRSGNNGQKTIPCTRVSQNYSKIPQIVMNGVLSTNLLAQTDKETRGLVALYILQILEQTKKLLSLSSFTHCVPHLMSCKAVLFPSLTRLELEQKTRFILSPTLLHCPVTSLVHSGLSQHFPVSHAASFVAIW